MKKNFTLVSVIFLLTVFSIQNVHSQSEVKPFKKNRISLGVFDMAFGEVAVKYERLFGNGQAGLFIPLNVCYYESGMYDYDNNFYSGLGLNYYPTGQGGWKYFCGLELNVGYGTFYHQYNYWDNIWQYNYWGEKPFDGVYTRFLINNGVMYSPTEFFSVDFHLGLGMRNAFIDELSKDERINPNASIGFNLSYKF